MNLYSAYKKRKLYADGGVMLPEDEMEPVQVQAQAQPQKPNAGFDGNSGAAKGIGMAATLGAGLFDALGKGDPLTGRKSVGNTVGSTALKGAAAGAQFGPIGAGVGAVVGAGIGLIQGNKMKKEARAQLHADMASKDAIGKEMSGARIAADPSLVEGYKNSGYFAMGGQLFAGAPDAVETDGPGKKAKVVPAPGAVKPAPVPVKKPATTYDPVAEMKILSQRKMAVDNKTPIEITQNAAKNVGLNPKLLYGSAYVEGLNKAVAHPGEVSEAYEAARDGWRMDKYEGGKKITVPKVDMKDYPVDGFYNYGLDTFGTRYDEFVKKGYLKPEFKDRFQTYDAYNEKGQTVKTAAFRTNEDAMTAKAAFLRANQDTVNAYAKKKNIQLDDQARDYFTMAAYNGGEGNAYGMMDDYMKAPDKKNYFTAQHKTYGAIHKNLAPRLQIMSAAGDFFNPPATTTTATTPQQKQAVAPLATGTFANGGQMGQFAASPDRKGEGGNITAPLARVFMQGGSAKSLSSDTAVLKGPSHEQGGIGIPELGANIEGGETTSGNFVFSKRLGFAQAHMPIAKAKGIIEKKPMTFERMNSLKRLNAREQELALTQEYLKRKLQIA
jgi:hypothetical protein